MVNVDSGPCESRWRAPQGDTNPVFLRSPLGRLAEGIQIQQLTTKKSLLVVSEIGRLPPVVSVISGPCDFAQGDGVGGLRAE